MWFSQLEKNVLHDKTRSYKIYKTRYISGTFSYEGLHGDSFRNVDEHFSINFSL